MSDKKKEATSFFGALGAAVDGFALLGEVVGQAAQTGMIQAAQEGVQMVKGTIASVNVALAAKRTIDEIKGHVRRFTGGGEGSGDSASRRDANNEEDDKGDDE